MKLHHNAAIRALRKQIEWIEEARAQLVDATQKARSTIQLTTIARQLEQCAREFAELEDAIAVLEQFARMQAADAKRQAERFLPIYEDQLTPAIAAE